MAAIVVSEIIDRLSPNMAPETHEAIIRGRLRPVLSTMPIAIGTRAPIVPIDVPVAVPRKADMMNIPAVISEAGMMDIPKLTVASTPPIALATAEKAPASRNIMSMFMISSLAAPFANILKFLLIPAL